MFSFHKPKVYRSTAGCCICKAKSSSSRFTDSKKYETDFIQCFQLENPRRGEICNACVLLVKRFKRLPPGSNRHWGHVVDARTGPGLKSMTKFKKRKEEQEIKEDKYNKIFKKSKKKFKKETSSLGGSSDDSPTESQHSDDYDDGIFEKKFYSYTTRAQQQSLKRKEAELKAAKRKRKNPHPIKVSRWPANYFNLLSDVVSDELWRQKSTCCGSVYECVELQAVIVNAASFKPCLQHQGKDVSLSGKTAVEIPQQPQVPQHTTAIKKHQLFLKRHSEPSAARSLSDISSSSIITEFSNNNDKTELMESTDERKEKDIIPQLIDIKFKTSLSIDEKKNGLEKISDSIENAYEQIELKEKLLQEVIHQEAVKTLKASSQISNHLLSSVNGDKMSMLKYKLANIARFGGIGNDNSSDSGYEEVVQDGGNKLMSMPPPADVMQSL